MEQELYLNHVLTAVGLKHHCVKHQLLFVTNIEEDLHTSALQCLYQAVFLEQLAEEWQGLTSAKSLHSLKTVGSTMLLLTSMDMHTISSPQLGPRKQSQAEHSTKLVR